MMSAPTPPRTDDELPPPPPSDIPRMFAGFATVVASNLTLVAVLSLMTFLLDGWVGAGIGLLQLVWVVPVAVWRFSVKDTPFASGMLIGAAVTLLLNLGGLVIWGFVAICGGM